jgi:hypothetical protein
MQKGREQAEVRGLEDKAQGTRQQEAGRGQVHHDRCDCHVDGFLASLAGVEGFKAYDCSNSNNPLDIYSLLDPEPCSDVAMDHVVVRMLYGEIMQMK